MAKKVKISRINDENEVLKLLKLVLIVSLIAVIFYVITSFVNKKETKENPEIPTTIQYDYILVGNILTQPNNEYYVLVETSNDDNVKIYEAYLSNYKSMPDSLRAYYVNLNDPFNSKFLKDESNFKIKTINEISFKETTLLLIKDSKIKKTYEGKDNITNKLKELTETN